MINTVQVSASKIDANVPEKSWNNRNGETYLQMVASAVSHIGSGAARLVCNGDCGWREALVFGGGRIVALGEYSQMSIRTGLADDNPMPIGTSKSTSPDEVLMAIVASGEVADSPKYSEMTIEQFAESLQ